VEESFKDAKTHWKLEQRRIQYADRMDRYLALLALLQAELCSVALALLTLMPEVRRWLGESGRNRLSLPNLLRRVSFLAPEMLDELVPEIPNRARPSRPSSAAAGVMRRSCLATYSGTSGGNCCAL